MKYRIITDGRTFRVLNGLFRRPEMGFTTDAAWYPSVLEFLTEAAAEAHMTKKYGETSVRIHVATWWAC